MMSFLCVFVQAYHRAAHRGPDIISHSPSVLFTYRFITESSCLNHENVNAGCYGLAVWLLRGVVGGCLLYLSVSNIL